MRWKVPHAAVEKSREKLSETNNTRIRVSVSRGVGRNIFLLVFKNRGGLLTGRSFLRAALI